MIWQPIETAPKDGTTVLLYVQKDGCPHECSVFVAKWTLLMTQYRQDTRVHQLMGWQIPPYGDLDAEIHAADPLDAPAESPRPPDRDYSIGD